MSQRHKRPLTHYYQAKLAGAPPCYRATRALSAVPLSGIKKRRHLMKDDAVFAAGDATNGKIIRVGTI